MVKLNSKSKYMEGWDVMCLGIPFKIVEIHDRTAVGELHGVKNNIRIDLLPKAKLGDYVMVHAGFAIEILRDGIAVETLADIDKMKEALNFEEEI